MVEEEEEEEEDENKEEEKGGRVEVGGGGGRKELTSMETTSLNDEAGVGRGCVAIATTTPGSPSSGYWSTNEDDLSNDVISASLGFDPSVGYGSCWLPSPYRDLDEELDDGDVVGLSFCADASKPEIEFEPEMRFQPVTEMDLGPEMVLETDVGLEPELSFDLEACADFKPDLAGPGSRPDVVDSELEPPPEMSLATGSSLLADFLFCDWLHGSRSTDRMFDDFISGGDVFPDDVFDGSELALDDPIARWKESPTGSPVELERRSLAEDDNDEEERTSRDGRPIFSADVLSFDLDPIHPFESFGSAGSRPISPLDRISLDCYETETPDVDGNGTSGCGSPLDVASGRATPVASNFRSSCLDSGDELFDVLLCEVLKPDSDSALPDAAKPELVLVATPSASKRKLSEADMGDERPRKTPRLGPRSCGEVGRRKRIELPVTLVAASSNMLKVTSACDRPQSDGSNNHGDSPELGKTQGGIRDSRTSGEFPDVGISHVRREFPKTDNETARTKSDDACARETTTVEACAIGNDACAVRRAEVLATMLQAEAVLREPNRGSDVIFAELRSGRKVFDPKSPGSVGPPSCPNPSQPRGGASSSLRSFLIRKQRDSSASGQNLLHRLLKGETSEAEVRREQAASRQTTRKGAVVEAS